MSELLPIQTLIESRLRELSLRRGELARRCGFKNLSKGVRRIDAVARANFRGPGPKMILDALSGALGVDKDVVDAAVDETANIIVEIEQKAEAERDAVWRAAFKPHGYLLGTLSVPSQITLYAIFGGANRWLKIPLDLTEQPVTFARQALEVVKRTPAVRFFGATTGFVINYTPDSAVRFDLDGNPVVSFDRAYTPGEVSLALSGRPISAKALAKIVGTGSESRRE